MRSHDGNVPLLPITTTGRVTTATVIAAPVTTTKAATVVTRYTRIVAVGNGQNQNNQKKNDFYR